MEAIADFGFEEKHPKEASSEGRPERENPIDTFDIERMKDLLTERTIGDMEPYSKFVNEVVWGNHPGAIRLWVNTGYGVYVDRLGRDLLGNPKWCTKKYYQINRQGYGGYEETVTEELFHHLEEVYNSSPDSPRHEFHDLQGLVIAMAERIKRVCRPIFLFDQIRKLADHHYLIAFNLRGHGLQAPDQKRMEKNIVEVVFYPAEGSLRVISTAYESSLSQHDWSVSPVHSEFCFFPSQTREEIIEPIATVMRFY
jgi:hypothetical protein